jgi:hypothetical protein
VVPILVSLEVYVVEVVVEVDTKDINNNNRELASPPPHFPHLKVSRWPGNKFPMAIRGKVGNKERVLVPGFGRSLLASEASKLAWTPKPG